MRRVRGGAKCGSVLPRAELAGARPFWRTNLRAGLVRIVDQGADELADMPRGRVDRVAVIEAGGAHLRLAGCDELAAERLDEAREIAMRIPVAHAPPRARPRRSRARRMRLRVLSYSRSDMA